MKTKIIYVFLLSLIPFFSYGERLSKDDFIDILKKYDIYDLIDTISTKDPAVFWRVVQNGNSSFQEALRAARNGNAREAQTAIGESVALMRQTNCTIPILASDSIMPLINYLIETGGVNRLYREAKLFITLEDDENAFSYPGGDVYLTSGLVLRLDADPELLLGVYAHELSHFVLQHAFSSIYFANKRARRDQIIGGILSGIAVGAAVASDISNARHGVYSNNTAGAVQAAIDIRRASEQEHLKYIFNYERDHEYEADIIAYRFMEWIGVGGQAYIEVLKRTKSELEIFQNNEQTHPLTENRIALLEFISSREYSAIMDGNKQNFIKKRLRDCNNSYNELF